MTRLKGKVISIPANLNKKPVQVMWNDRVYPFIRRDFDGYWVASIEDNSAWIKVPNRIELRELFVTTEPLKYMPLKYSQWQAAIDNGEVDSDKTVEFELITYAKFVGTEMEPIAKIIPAKKKVYTEEEIKSIAREAFYLGKNTDTNNISYLEEWFTDKFK